MPINVTVSETRYKITIGDSQSFFLIDKEGEILHVNLSAREWCTWTATLPTHDGTPVPLRELPIRFDVSGFRATYGLSARTFHEIYGLRELPIDLREIGYFCHSGSHYPASAEFQLKKLRQWLLETAEHLDNVSASLETMLLYVETPVKPPIPGEDHRNRWNVCLNARQYLRETNPLTASVYAEDPEDDEDEGEAAETHTARGVRVQAATRCDCAYEACPFVINPGTWVIRDIDTGKLYCGWGCLHRDHQPAGEFAGAALPDGAIGYRATGRSSCASMVCPIEIQENDLVLLDNHSGLLYCCRECLDYARQIMPPEAISPKP